MGQRESEFYQICTTFLASCDEWSEGESGRGKDEWRGVEERSAFLAIRSIGEKRGSRNDRYRQHKKSGAREVASKSIIDMQAIGTRKEGAK